MAVHESVANLAYEIARTRVSTVIVKVTDVRYVLDRLRLCEAALAKADEKRWNDYMNDLGEP